MRLFRIHSSPMIHVAYVAPHPIQYQAPLLRRLAACGELDLQAFFLSDFSVREHHEADFNRSVHWDVPLTEGYASEVLPRWLAGKADRPRPGWPVRGLRKRLRAGRYDAVWVHGWGHLGLRQAVGAGHALGLPVLLRGESVPNGSRVRGWRRLLRDGLCRRLFARCSAILCIGTLNRQFYREFGIAEDRMFDVPYAVDNGWFQARCAEAAARREQFRREQGLEPGRPIILFAAKFTSVKAPDDLLAAYLAAFPEDDPARPYLLLVGDGPLRPALAGQGAARAGSDVRFAGFRNQSELPAFYDLCDLLVLPSRFEPWGLVVNEVMNAGRAVIVSDRVGAAPDLVRVGDNGWIFPAGDVPALAGALREACADRARLAAFGARSRERIDEWDFAADERGILAALRAVVGQQPALSRDSRRDSLGHPS
jgi:glycosyltransferase involved in cell wall biosynthesis